MAFRVAIERIIAAGPVSAEAAAALAEPFTLGGTGNVNIATCTQRIRTLRNEYPRVRNKLPIFLKGVNADIAALWVCKLDPLRKPPIDLAPYGWPNCTLHAHPDLILPMIGGRVELTFADDQAEQWWMVQGIALTPDGIELTNGLALFPGKPGPTTPQHGEPPPPGQRVWDPSTGRWVKR